MTEAKKKRRAPANLTAPARRLWRDVSGSYELRPDEYVVLEMACRTVDVIGRLEDELDGAAMIVTGSTGQAIANPLLVELRQQRMSLKSLLSQLRLPDSDSAPLSPGIRSAVAREAAHARWRR